MDAQQTRQGIFYALGAYFIWAVNNQHLLEASLSYFINPLLNVLVGVPIIAPGLAVTFSLYGLLRKKIAVDAQTDMLLETSWLLPFAALYLFGFADSSTSHLSQNSLSLNLLLIAAGIVTTIPLMLFTAACTRLRLSTVGFFQYLGPTLMFLLAVIFYGEQMTPDKAVTFSFIWAALVLFIFDALWSLRRAKTEADNR